MKIRDRIFQEADKLGLTNYSLAVKAGVHKPIVLNYRKKDNYQPTFCTVIKLCKAVGITSIKVSESIL